MNIDSQIPVLEQPPSYPFKVFRLIGSERHNNLKECEISTWADISGKKDQFNAALYSQLNKGGMKNMSEYFSFSKTSIM
jgi:hypothetical protein